MQIDFATPSFWPSLQAGIQSSVASQATESGILELHIGAHPESAGLNEQDVRLQIREFLFKKWPLEFASREDVRNLRQRPQGKNLKISISHAKCVAGVITGTDCWVGLDIEVAGRVREVVANRIGGEAETKLAPTPTHLWCAKEAFYKTLPEVHQPADMKHLKISNWNEAADGVFSFQALLDTDDQVFKDLRFAGASLQRDGHVFAVTFAGKGSGH